MSTTVRAVSATLSICMALTFLVFAGCSSNQTRLSTSGGSSSSTLLASNSIGPDGGTVAVTSGPYAGTSITIPAGALSNTINVTISSADDLSVPNFNPWSRAAKFGPSGQALMLPVRITQPGPTVGSNEFTSAYRVAYLEESLGVRSSLEPEPVQSGVTSISYHTTRFSIDQIIVAQPAVADTSGSPLPTVPSNSPFPTVTPSPAPTVSPLIPPLSDQTFLTAVDTSLNATPSPQALNPDGTIQSNPVTSAGSVVNTTTDAVGNPLSITYQLRQLTNNSQIQFNNTSYTVYSMVPIQYTGEFAYNNLNGYYAGTTNDPLPSPSVAGTINGGNPTQVSLTPTPSIYDSNTLVYLATNGSDDQLHFQPNLPNGRDASGNWLDHNGLTENVSWSVNPFLSTQQESRYNNDNYWRFSHGWSFPAEDQSQTLQWNTMDDTNLLSPTTTQLLTTTDTLNSAIENMLDTSSPLLSPSPNPLVNTDADTDNPSVESVQQIPTWLQFGAFCPIMPVAGFQRNLLRQFTPAGSYDLANNTCDLFVRNNESPPSGVEIPAAFDGTEVNGPVPLVAQTWQDQQVVIVNNCKHAAVPSTQTDYPGLEYYFLSNTYLPGQAGVVTTQLHYPKITTVSGGVPLPDERQADSWLGLRGDTPMDTAAWMFGYAVASSTPAYAPQPNDLGQFELGGQLRKPYMFGASEEVQSVSNSTPVWGAHVENSNSFWWAQVPQTDDSLNKMYTVTFYIAPTPGGAYLPVCKIWWDWKPLSFDNNGTTNSDSPVLSNYYELIPQLPANPNDPSLMVLGTWTQNFAWKVTTDASTGGAKGFPAGWLNQLPGNSGNAYTYALAGPDGQSVSLTVAQAYWQSGLAPEQITLGPPDRNTPFHGDASKAPTDGSALNGGDTPPFTVPAPILRYQLSSTVLQPAGATTDQRPKVLMVLNPHPAPSFSPTPTPTPSPSLMPAP